MLAAALLALSVGACAANGAPNAATVAVTPTATPVPSTEPSVATPVEVTAPPTEAPPTEAPSPTPAPTPSPSASAAPSVSGIVAIGHSGLTGYGAGGEAFSWATGDDPSVDSIWRRVHDADPALAGDAVNRAVNGTKSDVLAQQMQLAFKAVASPALVIISTVDNDVRCDGTDDAHVPELGANVAKVLALITKRSPETRIVVVGEPGRPSIAFLRNLVANEPVRARAFEGTGPCALLDLTGRPLPRHVARLTRIINAYEAEEARVCAAAPQCRTDGGTRAAYVNRLENFATDLSHLNRNGQAAEAALLWPVVEQALGL